MSECRRCSSDASLKSRTAMSSLQDAVYRGAVSTSNEDEDEDGVQGRVEACT